MSDLAHVSGQVDARVEARSPANCTDGKRTILGRINRSAGEGARRGGRKGVAHLETRTFGGVALEDGGSCASESEGSGASVGALARSRGRAPLRAGVRRARNLASDSSVPQPRKKTGPRDARAPRRARGKTPRRAGRLSRVPEFSAYVALRTSTKLASGRRREDGEKRSAWHGGTAAR